MFVEEVTERSARLVAGAQALSAGTMTPQEAGDLLREGHTIKGTGRVMGYEDVGSAGLMLEMLWRWIQHGDITPDPVLGRFLEALSASIPRSVDDSTDLVAAMNAIHELLAGQALPEELPPTPVTDTATVVAAAPPAPPDVSDSPRTSPASPAPPQPQIRSIADDSIIRFDVPDESPPEPSTPTVQAPDIEPATESDAPNVDETLSAQEAFAALRRSMQDDSGDSITDDPLEERAASASLPERGAVELEVPPVANLPEAEESTVGDVHVGEDADSDGEIGSVIEFPRSDVGNVAEHVEERVIRHDRVDENASPSSGEVVVLPSSGKTTAAASMEASDLGGLVGAVQTWAVEESLSINAVQLYGLVNHIVSLRMDIASLKDQLAELAEVAAADPFFAERISQIADGIDPIDRASERIETGALGLAAVPFQDVTNTLPQLGRYLSRKTGKEIRIELVGDDILVDRQVLDQLGDSIRQLVVNAVVHGIEGPDVRLGVGKPGTGVIRVEAHKTDVNLEVSVTDDGSGIDWVAIRDEGLKLDLLEKTAEMSPDALRSLLYRAGFSTSETTDELAGDGAGLATVREAVDSMNGSLAIESVPGRQTTVSVVVPLHQAMQKALLVMAGGIMWGIPETGVHDVIEMSHATIAATDHATILERSDGDIPFASFGDLMGVVPEGVPTSIVIATNAAGSIALGVEEIIGTRRVAAKELGAVLADVDAVTGAALLGGDEVVLLVDTTRLVERQREAASNAPAFSPAHVLIVDDSRGVQQVVSSALATSGFNTSVAASAADALGALHSGSFDAIVVDFSMPRADGVALAHMVRQRHGDIPMVMLSGVAEGEDVDRARDAGVDAFFGKADFREGGLAEKLRELIDARRAREHTA
jgi:two-component system sensor histidine kinase and response regulator WspE